MVLYCRTLLISLSRLCLATDFKTGPSQRDVPSLALPISLPSLWPPRRASGLIAGPSSCAGQICKKAGHFREAEDPKLLATMQKWRQRYLGPNELPYFHALIDGLGIHFIHQRGKGRKTDAPCSPAWLARHIPADAKDFSDSKPPGEPWRGWCYIAGRF